MIVKPDSSLENGLIGFDLAAKAIPLVHAETALFEAEQDLFIRNISDKYEGVNFASNCDLFLQHCKNRRNEEN